MIVVLFGLVALVAAAVVYIFVGLIANNRKQSEQRALAERKLGFIEGELRTQVRLGDYTQSQQAEEVLRAYEANFGTQ